MGESALPPPPHIQHLSLDHLAFYRAWMEGTFDLEDLAKRYLGEATSRPAAKRVLRSVQDVLVNAARRAGKHGQARLLLLNKAALVVKQAETQGEATVGSAVPSFDDFLATHDPNGDFPLDEMWETYQHNIVLPAKEAAATSGSSTPSQSAEEAKAAGKEARRQERNGRLAQMRLRLISEIASALTRPPKLDDDVRGWFDEPVANRLINAGVMTIDQLIDLANSHGYGWHSQIPRLGEVGAERIVDWLQTNRGALGKGLTDFALLPPYMLKRRIDAVAAVPTLRLPEESLGIPGLSSAAGAVRLPSKSDQAIFDPTALDGSEGRHRAHPGQNFTRATNDHQAIQAWLARLQGDEHRHTARSYRMAAERLLYWAIIVRQTPLSSLITEDLEQFRLFLMDPRPRALWVSDRIYRRNDPLWRPFVRKKPSKVLARSGHSDKELASTDPEDWKAGLSARSAAQTMTILASMFSYLVKQGYLAHDPFTGLVKKRVQIAIDVDRSLSRRQWAFVLGELSRLPEDDVKTYRTRFAFHFAYATGMRLHEMAQASTADLERRELDDGRRPMFLKVVGKGQRPRRIVITSALQRTMAEYFQSRGLAADPLLYREAPVPLISKLHESQGTWHMSTSALYKLFAEFFGAAAENVPDQDKEIGQDDRRKLLKASTHWLRHTHGSHAAAEKGAKLQVIQRTLGHSSLNTTSIYIQSEDKLQVDELERFDSITFGSTQ